MAWSRARADSSRRDQARAAHAQPVYVDIVLECGHETAEPPIVRFSDGRERFACASCDGALRREKGTK